MNAKVGGAPWTVSEIPFFDKPTMIAGYDIHHKKGKKNSYLAFNGTINKHGNRYWSKAMRNEEES
jgi:aubergine-like protein